MAKRVSTLVDRFDGGMKNDPRDTSENTCRVSVNFDLLSNPRKMTPYRSSESGDSGASTSQKQAFAIALRSAGLYRLFALGVVSGQDYASINMKDLTTGASTDLDDSGWAAPANNESASGTTSFNLFVYYKTTGLIYGAKAGTAIWSFDPTSTAVFNEAELALTYSNIAQGLVHPKEDILYIPYDNKIARNNKGSWNASVLSGISSDYYITSICAYGLYTAVAIVPLSGTGNSYAVIWNQALDQIIDVINFGEGTLRVLEELEGYLIGIVFPPAASAASHNSKVTFRYYAEAPGSTLPTRGAVKFAEFISEETGGSNIGSTISKQKAHGRLYFMMKIKLNGTIRGGVWSVGRSSSSMPFAVQHERTPDNDTAVDANTSLKNFYIVGDYMFISYSQSGTFALSKTDDTAAYSHNSIYETKKFVTGGSGAKKDLMGFTITTEALPTSSSVIVKYKKDAETSFTTFMTHNTTSALSKSAVNIESSGAALPKDYKEIEFQIISTGGAEVTSYSFEEDVTDKRNY